MAALKTITLSFLILASSVVLVIQSRMCDQDANCSSAAHKCAPNGHCFMPSELGMGCEEDIQCSYWDPNAQCLDLVLLCECKNGYQRQGVSCILDPTTTLPPLLPTPVE